MPPATIVSLGIFAIAPGRSISEKLHRTAAALVGAGGGVDAAQRAGNGV
jgi:hypothetical protein